MVGGKRKTLRAVLYVLKDFQNMARPGPGKDFLENGDIVARSPSGTGYQVSAFGLLGLTAAWREGVELNVLGLVFGLDIRRPAIKLPGIGRLGFSQS